VLFGLFKVPTFTGTLSVAAAGREDVKSMLAKAIGCNTAWGFVDGAMFVLRNLVERGRQASLARAVLRAASAPDPHRLIGQAIGPLAAGRDAPALERVRRWLGALPAPAFPRPAIRSSDLRGAAGIFALVFASNFPVVLPFAVLADPKQAMRWSGAVAVATFPSVPRPAPPRLDAPTRAGRRRSERRQATALRALPAASGRPTAERVGAEHPRRGSEVLARSAARRARCRAIPQATLTGAAEGSSRASDGTPDCVAVDQKLADRGSRRFNPATGVGPGRERWQLTGVNAHTCLRLDLVAVQHSIGVIARTCPAMPCARDHARTDVARQRVGAAVLRAQPERISAMTRPEDRLTRTTQRSANIAQLYSRRVQIAQERFSARVAKAAQTLPFNPVGLPTSPWALWDDWARYAVDAAQRSVLFLDTLRQRGNAYLEHEAAGRPPLLHFDYEMVLDAREFAQPVNYALVRIVPPTGVTVDPALRPYVIIDPRAGHGPGIGGFKDDSQVGVALRAGHPVYFVIFFPDPQPGQTLPDVCTAEQAFVRKVRELHPDSPKPAIVGNCQGGWAAMMLAASSAEDTGPIVINGAPMSYWGGAFSEGEGDNPMRYAGGLMGGSWLASLAADLGNGKFDGAHLVSNFANLNPANALWDKYYNLYSRIDTEPPRFLEFERWWGGFYLMNREEIEWIVQNLFVGNKVWTNPSGTGGKAFDLRDIRSPIVLFASMGDNITPPQQAFNWVADIYGSTDEIKARGQVIVGLLHQDIGHLGIFVSGKVATKEHAQIVEVLKSIEMLPPGLYAMQIDEMRNADGSVDYEVSFTERSLEEVAARLNRFERKDEGAFEAVDEISGFNQKAYELFAQPWVQAMSNETTAEIGRRLNPMRLEQSLASDQNPWLAWVAPLAEAVRQARQPVSEESPFKVLERAGSEWISASLDLYRDLRDAASEAQFFTAFGVMFPLLHPGRPERTEHAPAPTAAADQPVVREALAAIEQGGYAEALARTACLLGRRGEPLPLARVELKAELVREHGDLLPPLTVKQWKDIRGRQEIICRHERERAIETLPALLPAPDDRERLLAVVDLVIGDPRVGAGRATAAQQQTLERIRARLRPDATPPLQLVAARKRATVAG
jgi:hypothetical protein